MADKTRCQRTWCANIHYWRSRFNNYFWPRRRRREAVRRPYGDRAPRLPSVLFLEKDLAFQNSPERGFSACKYRATRARIQAVAFGASAVAGQEFDGKIQ